MLVAKHSIAAVIQMQELTAQGQAILQELAQRYGVSLDAALTMLRAVAQGHGTMAQFSHPEFGGSGQWMQGGMTMVGDMFNNALKARVDGLCSELSGLLASQPLFAPPPASQSQQQGGGGGSLFVTAADAGVWWPGDLGSPSSIGAQNDVRYAVFPGARRLVVDLGGHVTVYDTLDHQIGGVSQQQGGVASLTFTSQYGTVRVADLPIVSGERAEAAAPVPPMAPEPVPEAAAGGDVFGQIEKLAALHDRGFISDQEFAQKKAELLSRI
jgi:hypothetical protein